MYKLLPNTYAGPAKGFQRLADNAFIPFDPSNTDYQAYLKWLGDGNVPVPVEGNTPEPADQGAP